MPRPIRTAYKIPWGAQFGAVRANGARRHLGTDYHAPVGTPIYGTGDGGVVTNIWFYPSPTSGFGHLIEVTYRQSGRRTFDAHLRDAPLVVKGMLVGPTTVLGYVGITGNAVNADPPGSHDHHQLWVRGVLTDPESVYGTETASSGATLIEGDKMTPEQQTAIYSRIDALTQKVIDLTNAVVPAVARQADDETNIVTQIHALEQRVIDLDAAALPALTDIRNYMGRVSGAVDLQPILTALLKLPVDTVAALKAAL